MKKPNIYYFRFDNFIADTHGMSLAAVGAFQLLTAHAWHRWNPQQEPFPFLPNDEDLLAKLCNRTRNWRFVRDEVLGKLRLEDGKWFYPPHREDALGLTGHYKRKAEKRQSAKSTTKVPVTPMDRAIAKQQEAAQQEQRDDGERRIIQSMNVQPAAPESEQRPWDEAPASEPGKLVYGLQGYRAVGGQQFDALLKHPRKLKDTDCVMFQVTDAGVKEQTVKVLRRGIGFALQLESGQLLTPD
jgi:uncharacterized protein YdaU (DUF1376 family)